MLCILCDAWFAGASARTEEQPADADAALGLSADPLHGGLPAAPFGDAFSLRFLGFERPMVADQRSGGDQSALPPARAKALPPGRNIVLEPILGSTSLLIQEGGEHLGRRKLMLPPSHGERMRAYEGQINEIVEDEIDSWPLRVEFPIHARMQAVTLEAILRVVFGVGERDAAGRLRQLLSTCCTETASPGQQMLGLAMRRFGGAALRPATSAAARSRRAALRRDRRAPAGPTSPSATTSSRC